MKRIAFMSLALALAISVSIGVLRRVQPPKAQTCCGCCLTGQALL